MIRVVIADDHAVVRHGLAQLLATFDGVVSAVNVVEGGLAWIVTYRKVRFALSLSKMC